jgi:hypothetical protein
MAVFEFRRGDSVNERPRRADYGRLRAMNDSRRLEMLRAKYRSEWDAHQIIADHNARLVQAGKQPSNEQLINEQRAAEAVKLVRDELMTTLSGATK